MIKISPIKKFMLVFKYDSFVAGNRPIGVTVSGDFFAGRCKEGDTRMLKIGNQPLLTTFVSKEITGESELVGHYNIHYATQYVSFRAYCNLARFHDSKIKLHF